MLSQVNSGRWCQESWETGSSAIRQRAAQLRKAGYAVKTFPMGDQITHLGRIKLTMIDVRPGTHEDTFGLPEVL